MFVIQSGYAYTVSGTTGYKISFDVDGKMVVDTTSTISITTQELLTYEEMFKKMNFKASIQELRKQYIASNASSNDISYLVDKVYTAFDDEELSNKMGDIVYDTVVKIENFLDDCVISFDKNGGTGTMADVRKEVGDKYKLPDSTFTAPEGKEFSKWLIGEDEYDVGDEITVTANATIKATYVDETPAESGTE
jgi:hypothetical protein